MTNLIYIVSFHTADPRREALYGGDWGAYTKRERAEKEIRRLTALYNETIYGQEYEKGLYIYATDKGEWVIEPMLVDD